MIYMSASSKKKLRKEQESELLTQRQQQEQKEAKKNKLISTAFIAGLILIFVAFIGIITMNTFEKNGTIGKWTTVATVGEHKLSLTEFNYYYVDAVKDAANELYSSYSYLQEYGIDMGVSASEYILESTGIDVKKPLTQLTNEATGKKYSEEFIETALNNAARDYALADAAKKDPSFKLSAEDQEILNNMTTNIESYAMLYGYVNANNEANAQLFLREGQGYGKYATVKSYIEYVERGMIADAYLEHYTESLKFTDAQLRAAEGDTPENYNSYSYTYYTVELADNGDDAEAAKAIADELLACEDVAAFEEKVAHLYVEEGELEITVPK